MSETLQKITPRKGSAINWYVCMIIILMLIIIAGMAANVYIMNKQFRESETIVSVPKQVNNPLKSIKADKKSIIKISEDDLQKFNDHIDYLSYKVETEVKRTQDNNQYDIDRVNVMLAIGMGLLTIIGGLLPLAVNFFSKEHLEKRMEDLVTESKRITKDVSVAEIKADKAKEESISAKNEAKVANESVEKIIEKLTQLRVDLAPMKSEVEKVKDATKKLPYIDLLIFQNAVAKLTSTDALKLFIGANRYSDVATFLQNLVSAIDSFDNDLVENNENFDVPYFKNIVTELKLAFRLGPIRKIPDGRRFQIKIDEAVLQLDKFEQLKMTEYMAQLKIVSNIISELKALMESKV